MRVLLLSFRVCRSCFRSVSGANNENKSRGSCSRLTNPLFLRTLQSRGYSDYTTSILDFFLDEERNRDGEQELDQESDIDGQDYDDQEEEDDDEGEEMVDGGEGGTSGRSRSSSSHSHSLDSTNHHQGTGKDSDATSALTPSSCALTPGSHDRSVSQSSSTKTVRNASTQVNLLESGSQPPTQPPSGPQSRKQSLAPGLRGTKAAGAGKGGKGGARGKGGGKKGSTGNFESKCVMVTCTLCGNASRKGGHWDLETVKRCPSCCTCCSLCRQAMELAANTRNKVKDDK